LSANFGTGMNAGRCTYAPIAFVNAIADRAEAGNHHPERTVAWRRCTVAYTTHSAGGALSDNDFICAAKANALYTQQVGA